MRETGVERRKEKKEKVINGDHKVSSDLRGRRKLLEKGLEW